MRKRLLPLVLCLLLLAACGDTTIQVPSETFLPPALSDVTGPADTRAQDPVPSAPAPETQTVQTETAQLVPMATAPNQVPMGPQVPASDPTPADPQPAPNQPAAQPAPNRPADTQPSAQPAPAEADPDFSYKGLVDLLAIDDSFILDQRYATTNNFTGRVHYDRTLCLVQKDIAPMLIAANNAAKADGYRIKIWDAYRPISVQQALHDSAPAELAPYVPAPGPYSMHARGITVDVTLCDSQGNELDMPTGFDDFSTRANSDDANCTELQAANRALLNKYMSQAGFQRSVLEWWHFDGPNRDNYEILDVTFAEFEAARDAAAQAGGNNN